MKKHGYKFLLTEDSEGRSSPLRWISRILKANAIPVRSVDLTSLTLRQWSSELRSAEALIFIRYRRADAVFRRQIHQAKLAGVKTVRYWVGSDVLYCQRSDALRKAAVALDAAVDLNVAVSPELVEKLRALGVDAKLVPSFASMPDCEGLMPDVLPRSVLAYLPGARAEFYGMTSVRRAAEAFPDLSFLLIGEDAPTLDDLPNVDTLSWVENMEDVWARSGLLLRMTEHDGLPRMILEALYRYRQVVSTCRLPGVQHAEDDDTMMAAIAAFARNPVPNLNGPAAANTLCAGAEDRLLSAIVSMNASSGQQLYHLAAITRLEAERLLSTIRQGFRSKL
ncbi:MAG: hypothetical protein WA906_12540 [Pacificimonas sp.]